MDHLDNAVRFAIDECILCSLDSLVLIGWILVRPGALRAVRLNSGTRSTPVDFEDCIRVERPDVTEKVAKPQGFTDSEAGFICFLPHAVTPGAHNSLEIELESGGTSCTLLPTPKLHGLPAMKRILSVFEAELPWVYRTFDTVIGPSVSLLNQQRLRVPSRFTEVDFGPLCSNPDYSLIVPLYGRLDYLEYQLALFPLMRRSKSRN